MPTGLGKWINCLRRRRRRGREPEAPAAPAPPSHRKPNNRTTEQPNRPSPPSPARVEQAYSWRKRPPMHPTRLRCCCSACSRFCALYFTCAAAAAHHQRGPLRHLRAAPGAAADAAAPLLHRRAHLGDASRHDPAGFMDAMPRGWQPCHFLWPGSLRSRSRCSVLCTLRPRPRYEHPASPTHGDAPSLRMSLYLYRASVHRTSTRPDCNQPPNVRRAV